MLNVIALLLAQAAPVPTVPVLTVEEAARFERSGEEKAAQTAKRIEGQTNEQLSVALTQSLSGRTKLIYQAGHGVFVEYTAPDGQLRMWYPNNVGVVKGSWGVRKIKGRIRACFRYRNAVNPLTQVFEPTECVSPAQTLSESVVLKMWEGDVFGLMADRLPYRKGKMDMPSPDLVPAAFPSP